LIDIKDMDEETRNEYYSDITEVTEWETEQDEEV